MQYAFGPQTLYAKAEPTAKVQFLDISWIARASFPEVMQALDISTSDVLTT